jgi:hypothetical protein
MACFRSASSSAGNSAQVQYPSVRRAPSTSFFKINGQKNRHTDLNTITKVQVDSNLHLEISKSRFGEEKTDVQLNCMTHMICP